jgi:DNA mismatch repair protein MutL
VLPESLDVNIHPTKTEVKFEDERSIYSILRSAIRKALGEHSITPTLDFERDSAFDIPPTDILPAQPRIHVNPDFNPFASVNTATNNGHKARWEQLAPDISLLDKIEDISEKQTAIFSSEDDAPHGRSLFQLFGRYIAATIKSGLMLIDQHRAHERILFEQFLAALAQNKGQSQQTLFPETIEFSPEQASAIHEMMSNLLLLGFDISHFGGNSFVLRGAPVETGNLNPADLLRETIDQYLVNAQELQLGAQINLAYSLARKGAIKGGILLSVAEMNELLDRLFACESPGYSPVGKPVISNLSKEELKKRFE